MKQPHPEPNSRVIFQDRPGVRVDALLVSFRRWINGVITGDLVYVDRETQAVIFPKSIPYQQPTLAGRFWFFPEEERADDPVVAPEEVRHSVPSLHDDILRVRASRIAALASDVPQERILEGIR